MTRPDPMLRSTRPARRLERQKHRGLALAARVGKSKGSGQTTPTAATHSNARTETAVAAGGDGRAGRCARLDPASTTRLPRAATCWQSPRRLDHRKRLRQKLGEHPVVGVDFHIVAKPNQKSAAALHIVQKSALDATPRQLLRLGVEQPTASKSASVPSPSSMVRVVAEAASHPVRRGAAPFRHSRLRHRGGGCAGRRPRSAPAAPPAHRRAGGVRCQLPRRRGNAHRQVVRSRRSAWSDFPAATGPIGSLSGGRMWMKRLTA